MASTRYHHGSLRAALLQAGLRIVAAKGPAALQLRDLAKAEGVSASAVYRHFPDLAHLSAEISRLARQQLAQAMGDAAAAVPGHPDAGLGACRRFDAVGRAYVTFAVTNPNLFATAFQAPGAPPSCPDDPDAWTVLNQCLDALVAAGELAAPMRVEAPMVAWSAVHGLAAILVQRRPLEPTEATAAVDSVMAAIRRALALRPHL